MTSTPVSRREFMVWTSLMGGGFLVGCKSIRPNESRSLAIDPASRELNAWVKVAPNGRVGIVCDKVEMGQGVTSLFTGFVADAFGVDAAEVPFEFAPVEEIYVNRKITAKALNVTVLLQVQFTGYSTSTADAWDTVGPAVMTARARFLSAAARRWNTADTGLTIENGFVVESTGAKRRLALADLINEAIRVPDSQLRVQAFAPQRMSQQARVDLPIKVRGEAIFGIDVSAEQMGVPVLRYAVLVRSPEIGARIRALNTADVVSMPGVFAVFPILDGGALAVVAQRYWQAKKAAQALRTERIGGQNAAFSSEQLIQDYLAILRRQKAGTRTPLDLGFGAPERIALSNQNHSAEYILPYLPHATLEPMNASCAFVNNRWQVWAPTQYPEAAQSAAARVLGVREQDIDIHTTYIGGGFGRRLAADFITQVAAIAKELQRRDGAAASAVKLVWDRLDDFRYDYFRPVACHSISASLNSQGIEAWRQEIATQSITASSTKDFVSSLVPDKLKSNTLVNLFSRIGEKALAIANLDPVAVEGASDTDYKLGRFALNVVGLLPQEIPTIPVGYWRSVGQSHSIFAIESFLDEIAQKHGRSALELRRYALRDSPRGLSVLNRCVAVSGYSETASATSAFGLARHTGWGSYAATVVRVELGPQGEPLVKQAWVVVDCGRLLQADIVRQQVEGGFIFGLSATLKQEVTIEKGVVREANFYDTGDIIRLAESPTIQVEIMPSNEKPTGVGELAVPSVAPAIANAVARLTGKRIRRLPLTAERIRTATAGVLLALAGLVFGWTAPTKASEFASGPQAFDYIFQVAMSPRCVNCHGFLDSRTGAHIPMVGENRQRHPMAIEARFPALGGDCTSCHQKTNFNEPRLPPGAANDLMPGFFWQMPPPRMVLANIRSKVELCRLWTDPTTNAKQAGSRGSLADLPLFRREFMKHVEKDPLIHWSFAPGPGRTPAVGSKEKLIDAMNVWIGWLEAGNSCESGL